MKTDISTIFLSGAGGYVGRNIIPTLKGNGFRVVAIVRRPVELLADETIVVDLSNATLDLKTARAGDIFIHMAAKAHDRLATEADFQRDTIEVARNVANAIAASPIRKVIHLSSIGARVAEEGHKYARLYGQMKLEAEKIFDHLAILNSCNVITIRPPLIYGSRAPGNFGLLERMISCGIPLPLGSARAERSYISVNNLVDLFRHLCVMDDGAFVAASGLAYEPSDGAPVSTRELALLIGKISGRPARLISVPHCFLRLLGGVLGRQDQVSGVLEPLTVRPVPSLKTQIGWLPPRSLTEGLEGILKSNELGT